MILAAALLVFMPAAFAQDPPAPDADEFSSLADRILKGEAAALEKALSLLDEGKVPSKEALARLVQALKTAPAPSTAPRLRAIIDRTEAPELREEWVKVLAHLSREAGPQLLVDLINDPQDDVAKAARAGVFGQTSRSHIDLFKKLLGNPDVECRLEAADALFRLDARDGYAVVRTVLEDSKSAHRSKAIEIVRKVRRKETVDLLLPLLDAPEEPLRRESREALLEVLDALFPYLWFRKEAPAEKIRSWWTANRP